MMDHSEVKARARTTTIPDGVYEAESYMDDDGVDIGKKVPIKVKVIVKADEMTIDLSDVSSKCAASTIPAAPPASAAPRSPINASPRRPIIRSMTAASAL